MKSDFRDLDVWKKAKELRIYVFELTKKFPEHEKYRLVDQMVRASRSITANFAEGYGRFNYQDNIRFCRQSRGSIYELLDHAEVSRECSYISDAEYFRLNQYIEEVLALLNGYVKYLSQQKKIKES